MAFGIACLWHKDVHAMMTAPSPRGADDAEIRRLSGYSRAVFARVFSLFRIMSTLRLTLRVTGGEMKVSIQRKPAFVVSGLMRETIGNSECPSTWDAL